nr:MAG TPA_asm: hypothetical protein [Bacteriophage sp.]
MRLTWSTATPRRNQRRGSEVFFRSPEHFYRLKPGRTENHLGHKREFINLFVRSFSLGGVEAAQIDNVSFCHKSTSFQRNFNTYRRGGARDRKEDMT